MGIRMLHRRAAKARAKTRAQARAATTSVPAAPLSPARAYAPDASTIRIPTTPAEALRQAAAGTWHRWAEVTRRYLALLLTWLPAPRPTQRHMANR